MIINESKSFQGTISLNNTSSRGGFDQMSDEWIDKVMIDLIEGSLDDERLKYQRILSFIRTPNKGAQKVITAIDKGTGEIIIINYGRYGL